MNGMAGMAEGIVPMAVSGAMTSVVAPALVLLGRHRDLPWDWDRLSLRAGIALPLFLLAHTAIMLLTSGTDVPPALDVPLHAGLLLGAILFWLPVLGQRHRLSDPARTAYLFLAAPTLDLAAVWIIARGGSAAGLAMIVAMLPIGAAAIAITWRWIVREDRLADERLREACLTMDGPGTSRLSGR
jgi:hypothetical protein